MPYANDDGISPWYNVNGTGEPLDRWVDNRAVVLDHAGPQRVHLSRTPTGTPLNVRFAVRDET